MSDVQVGFRSRRQLRLLGRLLAAFRFAGGGAACGCEAVLSFARRRARSRAMLAREARFSVWYSRIASVLSRSRSAFAAATSDCFSSCKFVIGSSFERPAIKSPTRQRGALEP